MSLSEKKIIMRTVGADRAQFCYSFEIAENKVHEVWHDARLDRSFDDCRWFEDGIVVAATCLPGGKPPFKHHWLAIRPRS